MSNNLTQKSKFLSLILRHNPDKIGINMDPNGYVNVQELCKLMPISKEDLDAIVQSDTKQRYSYSTDCILIRANQGHSIQVELELNEIVPPKFLYHGTAENFVQSIYATGINPGNRRHVHLSLDFKTAHAVGSRHGKPKVLMILAKDMHDSGHKFWLSANNVPLTKFVPKEFILD